MRRWHGESWRGGVGDGSGFREIWKILRTSGKILAMPLGLKRPKI